MRQEPIPEINTRQEVQFFQKKLLTMYSEKCNEEQCKKIFAEYNITPESLKRDALYLMEWLEKQPHLPSIKDEQLLAHFLIRCKNRLEVTKQKLDTYYSGRAILSDIFTNRDPRSGEFKFVLNAICQIPLPKLTYDGDRVIIYRVFDPVKADQVTSDEYLKMENMITDLNLKDDIHRKKIVILDLENYSLTLATNVIKAKRKSLILGTEMYPERIHKIILMRMKPIFVSFYNMGKNLISKKLSNRIELWDDYKNLSELVPIEILPSNYGGKERSMEELRDSLYEHMVSYRDWFKSEDNVKGDLSKRTDDRFKEILMHGVDGSFRKLTID